MMENKMKEYLGNAYSDNHLKNFCLYWMKGRRTVPVWNKAKDDEKLYYLAEVTLGDGGITYGCAPDAMGYILPEGKDEWIEIVLRDIENGKAQSYRCRIQVNALYHKDISVVNLPKSYKLRLSSE